MHRALQISEILVVILRAADKKSKLRTAAAMACTCWTFCEPANDVLWEALPCLLPLLNCLSGDAPADSERHLEVTREPGGEQGARFLKHAARVKSLILTDKDSKHFRKHLRTILFMRSRSALAIFPNMHYLEVGLNFLSTKKQPTALHLSLFLSPKTQTVQLWTEDELSSQALHQLAVSCPQLRSIAVDNFPVQSVEILRSFSALEEIYYWDDYGTPIRLAEIAHLPTLRHLTIPLGSDLSGITTAGDCGMAFTTLETLELRDSSFPQRAKSLVSLFQLISATRLRHLHVETPCFGFHEDEFEVADQALSALTKFRELRSLRFGDYNSKFSNFPPQPILKLHNLEKLHLNLGNLSLAKQGVIDLAKACPKLRRLQVSGFGHYNDGGPQPWSLYALEWFATHLPMLEYLETNIETSTVSSLETPLARSFVPISLVFWNSPLHEEHWRQVAAYISRVYPNAKCELEYIYGDDIADEDLKSADRLRWRYVARALAKARADNC